MLLLCSKSPSSGMETISMFLEDACQSPSLLLHGHHSKRAMHQSAYGRGHKNCKAECVPAMKPAMVCIAAGFCFMKNCLCHDYLSLSLAYSALISNIYGCSSEFLTTHFANASMNFRRRSRVDSSVNISHYYQIASRHYRYKLRAAA